MHVTASILVVGEREVWRGGRFCGDQQTEELVEVQGEVSGLDGDDVQVVGVKRTDGERLSKAQLVEAEWALLDAADKEGA